MTTWRFKSHKCPSCGHPLSISLKAKKIVSRGEAATTAFYRREQHRRRWQGLYQAVTELGPASDRQLAKRAVEIIQDPTLTTSVLCMMLHRKRDIWHKILNAHGEVPPELR
jgi:hypothetical protein